MNDTQEAPWYANLNDDRDRADMLVDSFLTKVNARFPMVVIHGELIDKDILGCHCRGSWDGDFDPGWQSVHLNASVGTRHSPD